MAKIGIVTVLYNSEIVLPEFFRTLQTQDFRDFVLIAVDNNSSDSSVRLFRKLAEQTLLNYFLFEENKNWGIAKGNNIGIRKALEFGCEYVLLSNNDIVLTPNSISILYDRIQQKDISIAVPKIHFSNSEKRLWFAGGHFRLFSGPSHDYYRDKDTGQADIEKLIDYSPTCFMLIKSDVFTKVGFMDESYFVYWDDTDFIWRAVHEKKLKLLYVPSSTIEHRVGFSSGGEESDFSLRYDNRNKIYFAYKNYNFLKRYLFFIYTFLRYMIVLSPHYTSRQRAIVRHAFYEGKKLSRIKLFETY